MVDPVVGFPIERAEGAEGQGLNSDTLKIIVFPTGESAGELSEPLRSPRPLARVGFSPAQGSATTLTTKPSGAAAGFGPRIRVSTLTVPKSGMSAAAMKTGK